MKRNLFVFLLSLLSLNLFCQVHWTKHTSNPVMVPGETGEWDESFIAPQSIIYHDSTYHMWYWGGILYESERIGHATSPDGITWSKDTNNPVLDVGPAGAWDDHVLHGCYVILIDSIFHMWYNGHTGSDLGANWWIGYATSPDGVSWTKDANNPVFDLDPSGPLYEKWFVVGSVIHVSNTFHMWYKTSGLGNSIVMGHATSPDGVNWTKDPQNPVLSPEPDGWELLEIQPSAVVFDGTTYHLWYVGHNHWDWRIGYAVSEDGSTWEKENQNNPVLKPSAVGSWDDKSVSFCSVIDSAGIKYKMWYCGARGGETGSIGYAESDTRIPYFTMESETCYRTMDTVVAEIALDGTIYIVPEGTPIAADSIIKYKLTSVVVSAYSEVQILLTDLSLGRYNAIAVSNEGFVSANPYHFNIVENLDSPKLEVENEMVTIGDSIFVTSDVDATIYLLVRSSIPENPNSPLIKTKLELISNDPVGIPTIDLAFRKYYLVAMDDCGFVSEAYEVSIEEESGIVNKSTGIIIIFPNPANDLLTVKTHEAGTSIIKISSLNGQLIYKEEMEGNLKQIDMTPFSNGIYFVTVKSDAWVRTEKVVSY